MMLSSPSLLSSSLSSRREGGREGAVVDGGGDGWGVDQERCLMLAGRTGSTTRLRLSSSAAHLQTWRHQETARHGRRPGRGLERHERQSHPHLLYSLPIFPRPHHQAAATSTAPLSHLPLVGPPSQSFRTLLLRGILRRRKASASAINDRRILALCSSLEPL